MEKYREYCELLGVGPGADAQKVRQSFRARIKKCHPDAGGTESDKKHAQLLIEAYSALKHGVPVMRGQGQSSVAASFWKKENRGRKASTAVYAKGIFAGKRMFESVFDEKSPHIHTSAQNFQNFFDGNDLGLDLEEAVYPIDEDTKVWEYTPLKKERRAHAAEWSEDDGSMERYQRAELNLRQIVSSFEGQGNRFQRQWAREFIGDLAQVQVLYRDLCRFCAPSKLQGAAAHTPDQ